MKLDDAQLEQMDEFMRTRLVGAGWIITDTKGEFVMYTTMKDTASRCQDAGFKSVPVFKFKE
jgi:hypothetical protein